MKVIHITPHLGTGIGNAYLGMSQAADNFECSHTIVLLEKPEKNFFVEQVKNNNCEILENLTTPKIVTLLKKADIGK
ncbi:MAG: hypothetical protein LBC20_16930 [Planctomycetaceae bacterium]|jgi:hypothetical protein|nr:hypothetical protein [Planctomycetaceae bacterium]